MQGKASTPAIGFARAEEADAEALVALRIVAMRESLERLGRFDPVRSRERLSRRNIRGTSLSTASAQVSSW